MRVFLGSFLLLMILGAASLWSVIHFGGRDLPSTARLHAISPAVKSRVYDKDDRLIGEFFREDRVLVTLEKVPPTLIDAVIAVEDRRFYDHWGVDVTGIARAAGRNVTRSRGGWQGGSTITQQLARNLFLTHRQTVGRKVKEAVLSLRIEQTYSKDEILEMYLNQIYFGEGAYGVQAASRNFFGKDVWDLDLAECATLAGIPRNPSGYNPRRHPERCRQRRDVVLAAMEADERIGHDLRTRAEAESLRVGSTPASPTNAPYFMEMVRQWLENRYGSEAIYEDGLEVHTTLDLPLQQEAEHDLEAQLHSLEVQLKKRETRESYLMRAAAGEKPDIDYLQGAVMVVDAPSGAMLAVVGGRSFEDSPFNRATQAMRQPGSAIKPFVFLTAIERGFYPSYILMDTPVVFYEPGQDPWRPRNYDREFRGPVSLRYALQKSLNVPTIKLQEEFGPRAVIETVRATGVESPMPPYRSIALGTAEVTLQELTYAYAVFANGGIRAEPQFITRVEDQAGTVLDEFLPRRSEVLAPEPVAILDDMMESVMDEGTGAGARSEGFTLPAGGKTGTTDDYSDAWFMGYTPRITTGVWVGYDLKKPIGHGMTGAAAALPIWTDVMKAATQGDEPTDFEIPDGVVRLEVCSETGLPASPECPLGEMELFLADKVPTQKCYLHGAYMDVKLRERWDTYRDVKDWGAMEEEREGRASPPR